MTTEQFWNIIESSRQEDPNPDSVAATVRSTLEGRTVDEVLGFERELMKRDAESYRWDLWAVAYIVNGGCSDDGFAYFRGWLIAKGRNYYEAALADPVRAADEAEFDVNECEDMLYVAASVYKKKTGNYPPKSDILPPKTPRTRREPAGEKWEVDDLKSLYPELCERFR